MSGPLQAHMDVSMSKYDRHRQPALRTACAAVGLGLLTLCGPRVLRAQNAGDEAQSARVQQPIDVSGHWVSLVTRDWRFRMVLPAPGDYQGIPINMAAKQFADAWRAEADEAAGKQCEAYAAPEVMLTPERLNISWQDGNTLQVQTDAGMQVRLLHFGSLPAMWPAPSWQGYSSAEWSLIKAAGPPGPPPAGAPPKPVGQLKVVTRDLLPGLLRKNGVPYSGQATLTEWWELDTDPVSQIQFLIVSAGLADPVYLFRDYFTTATFQSEPDDSKWAPTPCTLTGAL